MGIITKLVDDYRTLKSIHQGKFIVVDLDEFTMLCYHATAWRRLLNAGTAEYMKHQDLDEELRQLGGES